MVNQRKKVTLLVETFDVFRGGVPRYNRELKKGRYKNVIVFSDYVKNSTITDKLLNFVYRRRKILKKFKDNTDSQILHFTQPEILFDSKILRGKKVFLQTIYLLI